MSVRTENSIVIRAPLDKVFQDTSNLLLWPKVLPHYRWIHILKVGDDGLIVKMGARRGWLPIHWTSRFRVDPKMPALYFEHLRAFTRGMQVRWTYTATPDGVLVSIIHELDRPTALGRWFAQRVLSDMFIRPVAARTLTHFKRYLEQNAG
ncbi:MAG TPA: SRPBCC family protein [Verrucomicrobiae bacterium]|nr:SRPBCC family protein [Verrucomicrobiae bacterium]